MGCLISESTQSTRYNQDNAMVKTEIIKRLRFNPSPFSLLTLPD